jgi:triacylglycerol lipase
MPTIPHVSELVQRPALLRDLISRPPLWREGGRTGIELARLLRDPVYRDLRGLPDGEDKPVLLIPGFLAGDGTLGTMTHWLRRAGYRTSSAGVRTNVDCSTETIGRVVAKLECLVEKTGQPATIIGQSRGGSLARVIAVRHPDLVESIVALGSPQIGMLSVHPLVLAQVGLVGALGSLGVPGFFSHRCVRGDCCKDFEADLHGEFPENVRYVSVYSRSDGIVRWESCLDPAAECVEVTASHCGMAVSAPVYRAIADVLCAPGEAAVPVRRAVAA